jgi:3-methylfumaryl-CoA hydratase
MSTDGTMNDSDELALQGRVGRTSEATDTVTPRLLASYRATLAPHVHELDESIAPPGLHWCLAPEIVAACALGDDGHAAQGALVPHAALPRRMWASGKLSFLAPLRLNDEVHRRSIVSQVQNKQGRSGPLCFVTVQHQLANQRGPVIDETQVIVFREATSPPGAAREAPAHFRSAHTREVYVDAVMLFRYSALTFNAHRIHYDLRYATEVGHYADLVIHGPLQATLLLNFAARLGGGLPRTFSYVGIRAATGAQRLLLRAAAEHERELAVDVQGADGAVTMRAVAAW